MVESMDLLQYRPRAATTIFLGLVLIFAPSLVIKAPLFLGWTFFSALLAIIQGCYVMYVSLETVGSRQAAGAGISWQ